MTKKAPPFPHITAVQSIPLHGRPQHSTHSFPPPDLVFLSACYTIIEILQLVCGNLSEQYNSSPVSPFVSDQLTS